jgi:TPR repeat protein
LPFALCLSLALAACASPASPEKFAAGVAAYDAGDYPKAYAIFLDCASDDVAAMRNVALMLRKGEGVAKDAATARLWMLKAALAGLPTAQADLGEMLLDGEGGEPDPQAAMRWLDLAAAAGHPIAEFQLGEIYEAGQVVPQDLAQAKAYYAAAEAAGVTAAHDRLAALNGTAPGDTPADAGGMPTAPLPEAPAETVSKAQAASPAPQ